MYRSIDRRRYIMYGLLLRRNIVVVAVFRSAAAAASQGRRPSVLYRRAYAYVTATRNITGKK